MLSQIKQTRWALFLVILSACFCSGNTNAADEKEGQSTGIVMRKDYDVNRDWQPRQIMGKDFWLMVPYLKSWDDIYMGKLNNKPLFNESGRDYIGLDKPTILNSNAPYLNHIETRPNMPFFMTQASGRCVLNKMKHFECENEAYNTWKKAHPNFMGFINAETDNDFLVNAPWNFGWARFKVVLEKKGEKELIETIVREFPNPQNREELTSQLIKGCEANRNYFFNDTEMVSYMGESHCLDHIYSESSSGALTRETTNTCGGEDGSHYRHQVGLAFTRGAARQYNRNWMWYIAFFYNGYDDKGNFSGNNYPNYLIDKKKPSDVGGFYGPGYGMSPSLITRDMFLAYLSGANFIENELWPHYLHQANKDGKPTWDLSSPLGKAWEDWFEFTRKNPDRGASYAPVALLVPFEQGYPNYGGKSWMRFNYERTDWMIDAFMFTIIPHSPVTQKGDEGALSNSPYGDIYDVIVPNTPEKPVSIDVLNNYKVAVMLGKYKNDKALAERLMEYVKNGGTLLINIKQVNEFFPMDFLGFEKKNITANNSIDVKSPIRSVSNGKTFALSETYETEPIKLKGAVLLLEDSAGNVLACKNKFGKGQVLVSAIDCMIPKTNFNGADEKVLNQLVYGKKFPFVEYFLKNIVSEVLPLEVTGDIEYGLNKLPDGWLLYLINNKGVIKFTNKEQTLDPSKTAKVEVLLRNIKASFITELREQKAIAHDEKNNSFVVDVPPGGIRVIKIKNLN